MRWFVVVVFVGCSGDDRPAECAEVVDPGELVVDTSSGTPVFSWNDEAVVEGLEVVCPGDGVGNRSEWWVSCSAPHAEPAGSPLGTVCVTSPLTYGEDPAGVHTDDPDYYTAARDLPSGETCTVRLTRTCTTDGKDSSLDWEAEFVAP